MGNQVSELAISTVVASGNDGPGTEFIFPPPATGGARRDQTPPLLLGAVLVMTGCFAWLCWNLVHAGGKDSTQSMLTVIGLLALCLTASGVAVVAMLRFRQTAAESAQLAANNERLLKERDLMRTIVDNLPDCIYAKDRQGRFLINNIAHANQFGVASPKALRGKSDFDFFPRDLAEQFFNDEQKIIATGHSVINQEQFKADPAAPKGEKRWSLTSKVIWRDPNGEILGTVGITRDIHEFKLTQEALRRSEARLQAVLRRTRCILNFGVIEGPDGWQEHALDAASPFHWHIPVQNVEAAQEVFPVDLPPDKAYQQAWSSRRQPDDFVRMNKIAGDALLRGLPFYRNEFRCTDKNGAEHWMQEFVTLDKLAENRWQMFGITTDITDLKATEVALRESEEKLRRSTAQLEQSNRELQDFAYVASHDLQEPLRKIVVFGERLKEKCSESLAAEPRDYIERMQKAAARMQILINDLLTFSRLTTRAHAFVPIKLADIAREVLEDLESRIEQVKGRVEVGPLPEIDAEPLQMRQLLQNLIGNALKFRRPEEAPVVEVAARIYPGENGLEWCELTVSDNGIGFDEKYLDRIFNVFQRLHSRNEYEGTGMGLAIVRKIALHHGGNVTAKSQPGHGATFIVTLPVAHDKNENAQPEKQK